MSDRDRTDKGQRSRQETLIQIGWFSFRDGSGKGSEEAVLQAAREGDRKAFDKLVEHYDPELRRFLKRRVPRGEVEDVLQESWLAAWSSIAWFDGRCKFRTWLYGISIYKVKDHYRARGRRVPEVNEDHIDRTWEMHEGRYDGTELRESIRTLLDCLSEQQREVVELYYYAELTLAEISRVLNRNLNTVKYQFYRAHTQAAEHAGDLSEWLIGESLNNSEVRRWR